MHWQPSLTVVECHAEGEVGKVVTDGIGNLPGESLFEKKQHLERHRDDLRRLLLHEPRGAVTHSANLLVPSARPECSFGYIIMESQEYPVMSGSNTICVATVLLETGMVPMLEPVTNLTLESPSGPIGLECECRDGKVTSVRFVNQPAFAFHLAAPLEVEGLGTMTVDAAWGGMAYVLVDAPSLGFALTPDEAYDLCVMGQRIKRAAADQLSAVHPENPEYAGITQTEFTMPVRRTHGSLHARNAVVVSPGRIDRSPCGTGTSARLAVMAARGEITVGEEFLHESIIGSQFSSRIESLTAVGGLPAVVPSVSGQAWITEISRVGCDVTDPFPEGYTLSDTWMDPR